LAVYQRRQLWRDCEDDRPFHFIQWQVSGVDCPGSYEKWPNENFLRFGARSRGWILLNTVSVGYEWWRQLNNFPPLPPKGAENTYMQLHDYTLGKTDEK
jgi:hypothetical protein